MLSKIRLIFAFLITVVFISSVLAQAGKTTIDPNTITPKTSQDNTDPRLSKKVTYDSGYKRLHAVVDDLTQMTDVAIISGSSKKDWKVRDIPVVICVKDMPLGKLLKAIADATHTHVGSEKIGDDPKLSYRIFRSNKDQVAIDDSNKRKKEFELEEIKWQWDAMVAYGKSKEITNVPDLSRETWLTARIIASLGPDAKIKMLNGDMIRINGSDPATQSMMDDLYMYLRDRNSISKTTAYETTREDMDIVKFDIKLQESDTSSYLFCNFYPIWYEKRSSTSGSIYFYETKNLQDKGLNLPPYPSKGFADQIVDVKKSDLVFLGYSNENWDRPLLKAKIDLVKPDDNKDRTLADLMRAISFASGINIVMEDFSSQMARTSPQIDGMLKQDTTITDVLRYINPGGNCLYDWYINDNDKLMIGCSSDWKEKHSDLLSEEYLNSIKAKLDGPGLELDDIISFGGLSNRSIYDWIESSRDFVSLMNISIPKDFAWLLYDMLKPSDKLLAKSEAGLPLAKLDTAWIAGFNSEQKKQQTVTFEHTRRTSAENQKLEEDRQLKERLMCDPQVISTMVMRITETPTRDHTVVTFKYENGCLSTSKTGNIVPESYGLHRYSMEIDYKIDGEDHKMEISGPFLTFPIWSPQREAEVFKAVEKGK